MSVVLVWGGVWAGAGVLMGSLALAGGGLGHLGGWMAPVVLGVVLGAAGGLGGLLHRLMDRVGGGDADRSGSGRVRSARAAVSGAVAAWAVGLLPAVGIAAGTGAWLVLMGVGAVLGLVSGAVTRRP